MASWSVIRQATPEDYERMYDASVRFAKRHGLGEIPEGVVDLYQSGVIEEPWAGCSTEEEARARYLIRRWKPVMRRALRHTSADGLANGSVGWSVQ